MVNSRKRGQAALEFLTTYAWAFLVIIIMIGALAYFGILNPSKLLPERCNFGSEINCLDHSVNYGSTGSDGLVNLRLKNSVGEAVIVSAINVSSDSATALDCTAVSPSIPFTWSSDGVQDISLSSCNTLAAGFVSGEKARVSITVDYYAAKSSATYTKQVFGEVFSAVN